MRRIDEESARDVRERLLERDAPDRMAVSVLRAWLALHRLGKLTFSSEALAILGPFLARLIEADEQGVQPGERARGEPSRDEQPG